MDKGKQAVSVYDKIAEDYTKDSSKPSEYIDEFLRLVPKGGRVLDVGCGPGVDSGYMKAKGFEAVGIDLSKKMIDIAKRKFPQIEFQSGDFRELNFEPNSFDGILASFSLIHISKKDVPKTLKKFYRFLKVGGVIYVGLQAGKSMETFVVEPYKPDEKLFVNVFSYDEIKVLLVKEGFSVVKKYEREPMSKKELDFKKLVVIAKK